MEYLTGITIFVGKRREYIMANYNVLVEGTTTSVATVAEVKELLGDRKVTKKLIEEGAYPMVTLADAVEDNNEDKATEEVAVTTESGIEVVMVGDAPKDGVLVADATKEEVAEEVVVEDTTEQVAEVTEEVAEVVEPTVEEVTEEPTNEAVAEEPVAEVVEEPVAEVKEPIAMVDKAELAKKGFVVGATVGIHDDSMNEELLTAFLDADIDQAIIKSLHEDGVVLAVKGLDVAIPVEDLTVLAPPKADKPKKAPKVVVDPDKDGYPEIGHFATEDSIKKYIKALSNEQLQEWCELEGATWNVHESGPINRMRMAMSIKAKHFPHLSAGNGTGKKSKSKSKYGDITNEQFAQMCLDNDVEVRDAKGDARIERMYMIMDLRKAGVIE